MDCCYDLNMVLLQPSQFMLAITLCVKYSNLKSRISAELLQSSLPNLSYKIITSLENTYITKLHPCHTLRASLTLLIVKNPMAHYFSCCSVLVRIRCCRCSSLHPLDRFRVATAKGRLSRHWTAKRSRLAR